MCEFPLPSEADLIRRDMMLEVPAEGFKLTVRALGGEAVTRALREILRGLHEENPPFFERDA